MATAVDTIKVLMNTLKNFSTKNDYVGMIALDEGIRAATTFFNTEDAINNLQRDLNDSETYPDTDTRLQKATGIVIGERKDFSVDTGAITGSNAGGSTVKNAQDIVPEDGDLSTATLPTPGSTTQITYTGNDGKTFSFNVKWPDSFSTVVQNSDFGDGTEEKVKIRDSRYFVDLNTLDENYCYEQTDEDGHTTTSATVGQMKAAIPTILKGLNTYWLKEGAKLNYDSLGMALNGQTIEITFIMGEGFDDSYAATSSNRSDALPSDYITIAIALSNYGEIDSTNPNGAIFDEDGIPDGMYLDRIIAHEMVHAVMQSNGTLKEGMPQFFIEGVADLVQGDDDYNSEQRSKIKVLANNSDTLVEALALTPGTGSPYAYPAGDMLLRYLAQQSLDVTPMIGDSTQQKNFSYDTVNGVVSGYKEGDVINYNATENSPLKFSTAFSDDFVVMEYTQNFEDTNQLVVRNVRGKFITLNKDSGTAYAYMAESSSELNGMEFSSGQNYVHFIGSNYANDVIRAGNAGSQLWGGIRGNDELFGGSGQDTFVYMFGDGNDKIYNAESQDNVFIAETLLSQISSAQINDDGVYMTFTDGGSLEIFGQAENFVIGKDDKAVAYKADYQTKTWTESTK